MPVMKFSETPWETVREGMRRKLMHTEKLMSVLIEFHGGPWDRPDPYHSHPHEQVSCVVRGELLLFIEGEKEQHLREGDMFAVPPDVKHTVRLLTEEACLIDSFHPVREDFL